MEDNVAGGEFKWLGDEQTASLSEALADAVVSLSEAILNGESPNRLKQRLGSHRVNTLVSTTAFLVVAFNQAVATATADGEADGVDSALLHAFANESALSLDVLDLDGAYSRLCLPAVQRSVLEGRLPRHGIDSAANAGVIWRFGNILHSRRRTRPRLRASSAPGWLLDKDRLERALTKSLAPSSPEGLGHVVVEFHRIFITLDGGASQRLDLDALTDLVPYADGVELHLGFDSHLIRGLDGWFLAELVRLLKR